MIDHPLFQSVLEEPANDDLRLIVADWFEENGDARGEFIRLQVDYARLPATNSESKILETRIEDLLLKYGKHWNKPVHQFLGGIGISQSRRRGDVQTWTYRRGFIESVTLKGSVLLNHIDALMKIGPINELVISRDDSRFATRLLEWDRPDQIKNLELRMFGNQDIFELAENDFFEKLDTLVLRQCHLTPMTVAALTTGKVRSQIGKLVTRGHSMLPSSLSTRLQEHFGDAVSINQGGNWTGDLFQPEPDIPRLRTTFGNPNESTTEPSLLRRIWNSMWG